MMIKHQSQTLNIPIEDIYRKWFETKCLVSSCKNNVIKSHSISIKYIKYIEELVDGKYKVYRVKLLDNRTTSHHYSMVKDGPSQVSIFPGFCLDHDTELFKDIENNNLICLDSTNDLFKRQQAQFALRAIGYEIKRQDFNTMVNDNTIMELRLFYEDNPIYSELQDMFNIYLDAIINCKYNTLYSKRYINYNNSNILSSFLFDKNCLFTANTVIVGKKSYLFYSGLKKDKHKIKILKFKDNHIKTSNSCIRISWLDNNTKEKENYLNTIVNTIGGHFMSYDVDSGKPLQFTLPYGKEL